MRLLLLILLLITSTAPYATAPAPMFVPPTAKSFNQPTKWQLKKWKLQSRLYTWAQKLKSYRADEISEKQAKKATLSMILGISSIVLLFIPYLNLLALPAAILAIIFGSQSLNGNSNTKGIVGVVTGGVTVVLFIIALALVAAIFAGL